MTETTARLLSLPWTWRMKHEDGSWIVTIDELPDFFAAGDNSGQAAFNAREALASHLEGYLESGTPIPMPSPRTTEADDAPMSAGVDREIEVVAA